MVRQKTPVQKIKQYIIFLTDRLTPENNEEEGRIGEKLIR
jgi:hypothetical protein